MFRSARLKLTAWYLLIIMLISASFSMVIYRMIVAEVERFVGIQRLRIERRLIDGDFMPPGLMIMDPELVSETEHRLLVFLVIINSGILIVSGGLGYFLAGATLRPIQEMLDEQHRFISDSSHEFRTPLTSLKSAMEVGLRDKHLSLANARKLIGENLEEVNKLQLLSDELLQLAQFQKPPGISRMEKISLTEVISNSMKRVEPMAKLKNVSLKSVLENIEICGNVYSLMDLFTILIDNAVKYSPEKSIVLISAVKKKGEVTVTVKDNGIGIAEKDIPHIFDRFYRADSVRSKTGTGGYGLGLAIAKKIVEAHHGVISAESILEKGTIMTVRFQPKFSNKA